MDLKQAANRCFSWGSISLLAATVVAVGCQSQLVRQQSPEQLAEVLETEVVGDVAALHAVQPIRVEGVGLVVHLPGTGGDPPPSQLRSDMLSEMQRRQVDRPNDLLASNTTAVVRVYGHLKPGVDEGERLDIYVDSPGGATSLRNGVLLQTRLHEVALLNERVREGHVLAIAKGPLLIDPSSDDSEVVRGRILGGGISLKSRPLGLVITPEHESVRTSRLVANSVTQRFHDYQHGLREGVAKPKTDNYVELRVHPRYRDNIPRFLRLVRSIPLQQTELEQDKRLRSLERRLLDGITSESAAIHLEAIGQDGVETLLKGIDSQDDDIRFYAAEALAYLDDARAAESLGEAAQKDSAFRGRALAALGAMDDPLAREQLVHLLDVSSVQARYGAFNALRDMNSSDPLVLGKNLNDQFTLHVLPTEGPLLVHVRRSKRAEIVLFGKDQQIQYPASLDAGPRIRVNAFSPDRVTVANFTPDVPDRRVTVSTRLEDVIGAIIEVGGSYSDVVEALAKAKDAEILTARFEVDADAKKGRRPRRSPSESISQDEKPPVGEDRPSEQTTLSAAENSEFGTSASAGS